MSKYVIAKYIRLSIEDAKSDSLSIENQRKILDKHIESLDIQNAETIEFIDNGNTGMNYERGGVQELLGLIYEGKINCVAVKDYSRLGRTSIETGYFIERVFPLYGVRFIAVSDYFDSDEHEGSTGGMEAAFKFLFHEYYSLDLSKKIKAVKYEKMIRGEAVTKNCAFGYKLNDERKMVIDEPAADTVRMIFKLASEKNSVTEILKRLHEERRPAPREYKQKIISPACIWNQSAVRQILKDEQYMGMYVAGKTARTEVASKKHINRKENDWIKIPDHHPAIVDKTLFDAVQITLKEKTEPVRHRAIGTYERYGSIDNPLKGKVVCGCCKHNMKLSSTRNPRYHCTFTNSAADAECYRFGISAVELQKLIFDIISKQTHMVLNEENITDLQNCEFISKEQTDCQNQIELLNDKKREIYERFVLGAIGADDFRDLKSSIDEEIARIVRIKAATKNEESKILRAKDRTAIAKKLSDEKELTQELVDMLISRILAFPDNHIEVEWKIQDFFDDAVTRVASE